MCSPHLSLHVTVGQFPTYRGGSSLATLPFCLLNLLLVLYSTVKYRIVQGAIVKVLFFRHIQNFAECLSCSLLLTK